MRRIRLDGFVLPVPVRVALVGVLAVALLTAMLAMNAHQEAVARIRAVDRRVCVLASGRALMVDLVSAEAAQRAYLLTRIRLYVGPFDQNVANAERHLRALTVASESWASSRRLTKEVHSRVTVMAKSVREEWAGRHLQALRTDRSGHALRTMAQIQRLVEVLKDAADRWVRRAIGAERLAARDLRLALAACVVLVVGLAAAMLSSRPRRWKLSGLATGTRLQRIFDGAPIGMAVLSLGRSGKGPFIQVNGALVQMTGYSAAQLRDTDLASLTHPEDRAPVVAALRQAALARPRNDIDPDTGTRTTRGRPVPPGEASTVEGRWIRADGSVIVVQINVTLLENRRDIPRLLIAQVVDVTEERAAQEQLRHESLHDPLTGLANRTLYWELLTQALARAGRNGTRVGVLFIDLDDFKPVNDVYGHAVGDLVLQAIGRRLEASLRAADVAARLGGDEFAVITEDPAGRSDLEALRRRLASILSEPIEIPGVAVIRVTQSIGVSAGDGATQTAEQLTTDADAAMYVEKRRRSGGVYPPHTADLADSRNTPPGTFR